MGDNLANKLLAHTNSTLKQIRISRTRLITRCYSKLLSMSFAVRCWHCQIMCKQFAANLQQHTFRARPKSYHPFHLFRFAHLLRAIKIASHRSQNRKSSSPSRPFEAEAAASKNHLDFSRISFWPNWLPFNKKKREDSKVSGHATAVYICSSDFTKKRKSFG